MGGFPCLHRPLALVEMAMSWPSRKKKKGLKSEGFGHGLSLTDVKLGRNTEDKKAIKTILLGGESGIQSRGFS